MLTLSPYSLRLSEIEIAADDRQADWLHSRHWRLLASALEFIGGIPQWIRLEIVNGALEDGVEMAKTGDIF